MKIFPESNYLIELKGDSKKAIADLQNETLSDTQFIVDWGNKPFMGTIKEKEFEIKKAKKTFVSFWVINGTLNKRNGVLKVQINKMIKILIGVFFIFIISGLIISLIRGELELVLRIILFILLFRFGFIEFGFRLTTKSGINQLTNIIGITELKKTRHNNVYN